jgi:hypothetical protein
MDMELKQKFIDSWSKYFTGAELPLAFYYTGEQPAAGSADRAEGARCVMMELNKARLGKPLYFDNENIGCFGGKRYFGYDRKLRPGFEFFLSCGIPGKMEGERYKKSPELVNRMMEVQPLFEAPGKYLVFKRWDTLVESDDPAAVIFFARPDVLSGLFTLAGFDEEEPSAIYAPFSAGCGSIVQYPYLEISKAKQKCILGLFDVSARPFVPQDALTFAAPMKKFTSMVDNMDESFLTTESWEKIRVRIAKANQ